MKTRHRLLIALLSVSSLCGGQVYAGIYRYQDANGHWQYTDKAPPDQSKAEVVTLKSDEAEPNKDEALAASGNDLAAYLTLKVNPASDIERATLAVVKVQTSYGSGSGFFVNEKGFLITNKHVVRPGSSDQISGDLTRAEEQLKQAQNARSERSTDLDRWKRQIDAYQARMDSAPEDQRPHMQEEYQYHISRYRESLSQFREAEKQLDNAKRALEMRRNEMTDSDLASSFKIIFKDGTEKQAELVTLAKDHDLALLRIVGNFKTPFLDQGQRESAPQGSEVYAIGSPLGLQDYVTKGIVTRQETDKIVTDTEILPGNSGGPLITPSGKVIGVNTMSLRAGSTIGTEVFGYAIPIDAVRAEFSSRW